MPLGGLVESVPPPSRWKLIPTIRNIKKSIEQKEVILKHVRH